MEAAYFQLQLISLHLPEISIIACALGLGIWKQDFTKQCSMNSDFGEDPPYSSHFFNPCCSFAIFSLINAGISSWSLFAWCPKKAHTSLSRCAFAKSILKSPQFDTNFKWKYHCWRRFLVMSATWVVDIPFTTPHNRKYSMLFPSIVWK